MDVIKNFVTIIKNKYNGSPKILEALDFAQKAHEGQKRDSGEDYVVHPVCVATILTEYGLDEPAIIAGLLHDTVEDTSIISKDIRERFGKEVEELVKGVTKVSSLKKYFKTSERDAESLRKMLISMAKDIRVVLIKLADRLHNMRTLSSLSPARQIKIAKETQEIFVPLADRLGLSAMRGELADLCLFYLNPTAYKEIETNIKNKYAINMQLLENLEKDLRKILNELKINGEVSGRIKHISSIYKKLNRISADKIFDILALRVIVNSVQECYSVLGAIHNKWKPIAGLIKDYIATPKLNGYQSLHSTLLTQNGTPFELQIRTHEMHKNCEYGIAAHWRYKDGDSHDSKEFADKLDSIKQLVESTVLLKDNENFVNAIKLDFETSEIWVFTPQNKVITLQKGSTPIDFAYAIHSKIGNNCIGAKVNGKIVPLNTKLETGNNVEIITSPHDKAPSRDWLNVVCMSSTKSKIRSFFRKEMKAENIERGKEMLEVEANNRGYSLSVLLINDALEPIYKTYTFSSLDDLYASVGAGSVTTNQILGRLISYKKKIEDKSKTQLAGSYSNNSAITATNRGILVYGDDDIPVKFCKSCAPVYGDEIVGFSVGRGITVHRPNCNCVKTIPTERKVEVSWIDAQGNETYNAVYELKIEDRAQILTEIINTLAVKKIYINSIGAKTHTSSYSIAELSVKVKNATELQEILNKISQIDGVYEIKRK